MVNGKVILIGVLALLAMPPAMAGEGLMLCRAGEGEAARQWIVRLRLDSVQAEVDGQAVPADYQHSHARLSLPDGRTLTIGRSSGRLLVMDANGHPLFRGACGMAGQQT